MANTQSNTKSSTQKRTTQTSKNSNKKVKKTLNIVLGLLINLVIVLILVQAFSMAFNFGYKVFADISCDANDTVNRDVTILPDSSTMEIVDTLVDAGVVKDKYVVLVKIKLGKYNSKLMPGTYQLNPSMTMDEVLDVISGETETTTENK